MMASAIFLLYPHFEVIRVIFDESNYANLINFPFILLGLLDFVLGILLFLSVTEVYPILRGRGMLTLGFGVYVGWALTDPILTVIAAAAGVGINLSVDRRFGGDGVFSYRLGQHPLQLIVYFGRALL